MAERGSKLFATFGDELCETCEVCAPTINRPNITIPKLHSSQLYGNLCLSPRVSTAESEWLTFPRLTTFTTPLNATDVQVQYGGGRHDHYKRLSSSGYDACFSTPSNSNCVVVDQSSKQCTCHELHGSMSTTQVPSHYEHLQMNSGVSGRSLEHQRRLQLISQNPVMSLRRLHSSTSQPRSDDDIDQLHELTDQQLVVC